MRAARVRGGDGHAPDAGELDRPRRPCARSRGKVVQAWALEGDLDADAVRSNTFEMEWPPRSGAQQEFPEVDRAGVVFARRGARSG